MKFILFSMVLFYSLFSVGQPLLVPSGSSSSYRDKALDSGRYVIKKQPKIIQPQQTRPVIPDSTATLLPTQTKSTDEDLVSPLILTDTKGDQNTDEVKTDEVKPNASKEIEDRPQLEPLPLIVKAPVRFNMLEVEIAPMLFYNDSSSDFSHRNYYSFSQGLSLGANMWVNPLWGIDLEYNTSVGGHVKGTIEESQIPVTHQWYDVMVCFRNYFGDQYKPAFLDFLFGFSDYQFKVPGNNVDFPRLKSSGVKLKVQGKFFDEKKAKTMGFYLMPRLNHAELETGINLTSGNSESQNRLGLFFGEDYYFSGRNQLFWLIDYSIEKNLFSDESNINDPHTGSPAKGVAVGNSFIFFKFGVRWGR